MRFNMGRQTNKVLLTTPEEINKILINNKELTQDFINYLETTDHSPKSIVVYKNNLNIFFVYLMQKEKNIDFVDIKKRHIMNFQNFMIKGGLSPARIRNIKSTLSSLGLFIEAILDEEKKWENFRNIINKIPSSSLSSTRTWNFVNFRNIINKIPSPS